MPRASKSQWDFGELFSAQEMRRVLTVSELTAQVKRLIEQHVGTLWVTGEITNLREQSSGHIYFTLKDASTQVACVLFRRERVPHRNLLEDGVKVILQGDVTVYEARGQYQVIVRQVELQGIGALQAAFEKLKQKLADEGLFAEERKRPLPSYPQCVGLVTSPTAAALRDILHVVQRRNPALRMILAPCRVQGDGAAHEIAEAIGVLNEFQTAQTACPGVVHLDALLITRGGGSLEDLWAFNEEEVARAIAASAIPVMSAVGHEIDFTISDFVADVRAATPSAAAEILTEGVFSASTFVREVPQKLKKALLDFVGESWEEMESVIGRLGRAHPRRRLNEASQRLDDLQSGLGREMHASIKRVKLEYGHLVGRFSRCQPQPAIAGARERLDRNTGRLIELTRRSHQAATDRLRAAEGRLLLLSPERVLARGYSLTTDATSGKVIRAADQTVKGQTLETRLHKGSITSRVEAKQDNL